MPVGYRAFLAMLRFVLLLALVTPAYAGLDCDDDASIKDLEAFAKTKTDAVINGPNNYSWLCVSGGSPKLKPRIAKACEKILDRDGEKHNNCIIVAASAGIVTLGKHDIFALVGTLDEDPIEFAGGVGWTKTALYGQLADPRGAAIVTQMWKDAIPRADKREKRHGNMTDWSSWRQSAARTLATIGDADTKTFLEQQADATVDKAVRRECLDAAAKIGKRVK
jgi:hypothetical protein